jgi:hypothetical protein
MPCSMLDTCQRYGHIRCFPFQDHVPILKTDAASSSETLVDVKSDKSAICGRECLTVRTDRQGAGKYRKLLLASLVTQSHNISLVPELET